MEIVTLVRDARVALSTYAPAERAARIFWLLGPFILLIERSPADIWVSVLALWFVGRSIARRDGAWLRVFWVRAAILFWGVCLLSAALSPLPAYSLGETFAWFRFPLFAMASVFWLGTDRRMVYAMLISMALGMLCMCGILLAEIVIVGAQKGRLTWPYGDMVPGNYLAKVCLAPFVVSVSLALSVRNRLAAALAAFVLGTICFSVLTGERINLLIRVCSGALAMFSWRPRPLRLVLVIGAVIACVTSVLVLQPNIKARYIDAFATQIPIHAESPYYKVMATGVLAFEHSPVLGVGPGNLRKLCPDLAGNSSKYACNTHPHNFYIQMAGEAGAIGLFAGVIFLGSIVWACVAPALRNRKNVVVATMWIVPFGLLWPIASTADFFGQWNNIFMWSAIAVALAGSRIGSDDEVAPKG